MHRETKETNEIHRKLAKSHRYVFFIVEFSKPIHKFETITESPKWNFPELVSLVSIKFPPVVRLRSPNVGRDRTSIAFERWRQTDLCYTPTVLWIWKEVPNCLDVMKLSTPLNVIIDGEWDFCSTNRRPRIKFELFRNPDIRWRIPPYIWARWQGTRCYFVLLFTWHTTPVQPWQNLLHQALTCQLTRQSCGQFLNDSLSFDQTKELKQIYPSDAEECIKSISHFNIMNIGHKLNPEPSKSFSFPNRSHRKAR